MSEQTLAERFLHLEGEALLAAYPDTSPLELALGGRTHRLPAELVHEPEAGGRLAEQSLAFVVDENPFHVSTTLDGYVRPVRELAACDARLFDGQVVRLASFSARGATLMPASYFDALATNLAMDHRPSGKRETLRDLARENGRLGDFRESPLVNHVGLVCMFETSDGMLVAQRRSARVANRPHGISASVSGALDWSDLPRNDAGAVLSLSDLVAGIFREALEELGAAPEDLRYLALVREYLRGGKPELYFYARTSLSTTELTEAQRVAESREESRALRFFEFHSERVSSTEPSKVEFRRRTEQVLNATSADADFTFVAGTLLAARHVLGQAR